MFVGISGFPMAVNLHEAGFKVISYDAFKGVYEKVQASGITMVEMLKEVSRKEMVKSLSLCFVIIPKMLNLFLVKMVCCQQWKRIWYAQCIILSTNI